MKIKSFNYILAVLPILLMVGCVDSGDSFYKRHLCDMHFCSIGLIKPCYLGSSTGIDGKWYISDSFESIKDVNNSYGSMEVSHIDVIDSIIVGYNSVKWRKTIEVDTIYSIIILGTNETYEFSSKKERDIKHKEFIKNNINIDLQWDRFKSIEGFDTIWHIQDISKKIGYEYRSKKEFNSKLKDLTNKDVTFIAVHDLAHKFINKEYPKWYPKEYK